MASIPHNDNLDILAPKNIDNSQGVFESGKWRPYNSIAELKEKVLFPADSLTYPIRNGEVIETWQVNGDPDSVEDWLDLLVRVDSADVQTNIKIFKKDLQGDTYTDPIIKPGHFTLNMTGIGLLTEGEHYSVIDSEPRGFQLLNGIILGDEDYITLSSSIRAGQTVGIGEDQKGAPEGVASLDQNAKIPDSQLPDAVALKDDVIPVFSDATSFKKIGDTSYNVLDVNTKQYVTFDIVTDYYDGTPMTPDKVDGYMYKQEGEIYLKRNTENGVNIKIFGAKGDGVTDDWANIQNGLNILPPGCTVIIESENPFLISDAIYIKKRLNIVLNSPLISTSFEKPHIIIDEVDDVSIEGVIQLLYEGIRPNIKFNPNPSSLDERINTIYQSFEFTRDLSCGVMIYKKCNRLNIANDVYVKGKVIGIAQYTSGSDQNQYSDNININSLTVDTVDFGYYSGGFKNLSIGSINASNITTTQGDPSHAIYVTQRITKNSNLYIGAINLNKANLVGTSDDYLLASDAYSIRSTDNVYIGNVNVMGAQYIGNVINSVARINNINAKLEPIRPGTSPTGFYLALQAQSGGVMNIGNVNIESKAQWNTGDVDGTIISASETGSIIIGSGKIKMLSSSPVRIARLATSGKEIRLKDLTIEYTNDFSSSYVNPAAIINLSNTGELNIINPSTIGVERLFYNGVISAKWKIYLDQNLLSINTNNTIIDATGVYNIEFINSSVKSIPIPSASGTYTVQMRGRNNLITSNLVESSIGQLSGLSNGQVYKIYSGDNYTSITNNANIRTLSGENIDSGVWDCFVFQKNGNQACELYTLYKTPAVNPTSKFSNDSRYAQIANVYTKTESDNKYLDTPAAASPDTAANVGAVYSQSEVQAILDELRDFKSKMRTAGLLTT